MSEQGRQPELTPLNRQELEEPRSAEATASASAAQIQRAVMRAAMREAERRWRRQRRSAGWGLAICALAIASSMPLLLALVVILLPALLWLPPRAGELPQEKHWHPAAIQEAAEIAEGSVEDGQGHPGSPLAMHAWPLAFSGMLLSSTHLGPALLWATALLLLLTLALAHAGARHEAERAALEHLQRLQGRHPRGE